MQAYFVQHFNKAMPMDNISLVPCFSKASVAVSEMSTMLPSVTEKHQQLWIRQKDFIYTVCSVLDWHRLLF